jgi:PhnB protein
MSTKPVPEGYHTITPYLHVPRAIDAMAFYEKAFGAKELMRLTMPDGSIGHAEMRIGDSAFMMADENQEWNNPSPLTLGGTSAGLMIYVDNVDEVFAQAVAAGATVLQDVTDQFYGDRSGTISDPFGHKWTISTHVEDVSEEEMDRRMKAMYAAT